jgi:hypothetical protein
MKQVRQRRSKCRIGTRLQKAAVLVLPDGRDEVQEAIDVIFECFQMDCGTRRGHTWCAKCTLGCLTKNFDAVVLHPSLQRLLAASLDILGVGVRWDLVVHSRIGVGELLLEGRVEVVSLLLVKPHEKTLVVGLMFCEGGSGFGGLTDVLRVEVLTEFSQAASGIDGIGVVVGWVGCGVVVVGGSVVARSDIVVVVVDVVTGSELVGPADRQQQLQMPG